MARHPDLPPPEAAALDRRSVGRDVVRYLPYAVGGIALAEQCIWGVLAAMVLIGVSEAWLRRHGPTRPS